MLRRLQYTSTCKAAALKILRCNLALLPVLLHNYNKINIPDYVTIFTVIIKIQIH